VPSPGLKKPWGLAVTGDGHVYVADYGNRRVLELEAP
jgi:DNA-binding beta-propeller fold protein YncE